MEKKELLYKGKAKEIFATSDPGLVIMKFLDDATAFDGKKKGTIGNKGVINATVTNHVYQMLEKKGIKTHLVERLSDDEMLVKHLEIIPIEVVLRNVVAGSLHRRTGFPEGTELKRAIYEFYYKDDELGDPMINEEHIDVFGWATKEEVDFMRETGFKVNDILVPAFGSVNITLIDYKLEFGRTRDGEVVLADEITPDGCRLWDSVTKEKMDKDRFRRDMGGIEEAYNEAEQRILSLPIE